MTMTAETQQQSASLQPIIQPTEPLQYRAIGLLWAKYIPDADDINKGKLITTDGTIIDAVAKGRGCNNFQTKLDLNLEQMWVVYPKRPLKDSPNPMSVRILRFWNQRKKENFSEIPREYFADYFSMQGEVIDLDHQTGNVNIKVKRLPKEKNEPAKIYYFKLIGYLPPKSINHFWNFNVRRVGADFVIQSGECIAPMDVKEQVEPAPDHGEGLTVTDVKQLNGLAQPSLPQEKQQKKRPSIRYKKLETAVNTQGETFTGGEKIRVNTCNFGECTVIIKDLYQAADGSVWANYSPGTKNKKHLWLRGCSRIEHLKKLN